MPATATSNNSSKSSGAPRETPEDSVKNGSVRWVDLMPQKFDNKDQEEQGSQGIPVFPGWLSKAYVHKPKKLNWNSKSAHDISWQTFKKITCASVDRFRLDIKKATKRCLRWGHSEVTVVYVLECRNKNIKQ